MTVAALAVVLSATQLAVGPVAGGQAVAASGRAAAARTTVVSLTFDDSTADQMVALPIMEKYAMPGTFYVISGYVGEPGYLSRTDLATIAAKGHEIAGHTISHPDLTTVPAEEAKRQVCNSRATLTSWGYPQTSFAYPYAALNAQVQAIVRECGYNSARGLGDLQTDFGCPGCPYAGRIPPENPYDFPAADMHDSTWTLGNLQVAVLNAERFGGWLPLTFHHVCDNCDPLSISPTLLDQFLSWLKTRQSRGTTVKTVNQVIGGPVQPVVTVPDPGTSELKNVSLEDSTSGSGFPDCWQAAGYGVNTPTWARTNDARTGSWAQQLTVTGYSSGDAKLLPSLDLGTCSPTITPGTVYTIGAWYKSTATTQFAVYYRNPDGAWRYWTSSPYVDPAAGWTLATWTTPPAPPEATGISFGLALIDNGTLVTDDYSLAPVS
jgi:peptidoglycan/xylan/chitin deacetylase (PgdA/CDA1 family)